MTVDLSVTNRAVLESQAAAMCQQLASLSDVTLLLPHSSTYLTLNSGAPILSETCQGALQPSIAVRPVTSAAAASFAVSASSKGKKTGGGPPAAVKKMDAGSCVPVQFFFAPADCSDPVPTASLHFSPAPSCVVSLSLDCITYCPLSSPVSQALSLHASCLSRQLSAAVSLAAPKLQPQQPLLVSAAVLQPPLLPHRLCLLAVEGLPEEEQVSLRRSLHQRLLLPLDRPLLRPMQALPLESEPLPTLSRLKDVHIGLGPSGVEGGQQFLVQGSYLYYHYMQDKFNDKGWGCAYRSLQTLASWFQLQHYTSLSAPAIPAIQQILVDAGDKEASLLGSKEWIGAFEVNLVLDNYLGVTSKILTVPKGAELVEKGRELAHHFVTQGTPVMMGGGEYAYTLLGIDYNELTGDIRFLILDPHYTGADELKTIQEKGWCGWKTVSLFDQEAWYNLCMPQRPNIV